MIWKRFFKEMNPEQVPVAEMNMTGHLTPAAGELFLK